MRHCLPRYSFRRLDEKESNRTLYPGLNFRWGQRSSSHLWSIKAQKTLRLMNVCVMVYHTEPWRDEISGPCPRSCMVFPSVHEMSKGVCRSGTPGTTRWTAWRRELCSKPSGSALMSWCSDRWVCLVLPQMGWWLIVMLLLWRVSRR